MNSEGAINMALESENSFTDSLEVHISKSMNNSSDHIQRIPDNVDESLKNKLKDHSGSLVSRVLQLPQNMCGQGLLDQRSNCNTVATTVQ
jgi:hypothetical protein